MIDDDTLTPDVVRLGTITAGHTMQAQRQDGSTYTRPEKADTLVFHTNDLMVARSLVDVYGGTVHEDSPNWRYDVVSDATEVFVDVLPSGFRQWLEQWATAKCLRRCTGTTMVTRDGKPTDEPCLCEREGKQGSDRECKPHTTLPVLLSLPVDRFGVWECRSTSWSSARAIKAAMNTLALVGATSRITTGILRTEPAQVRDAAGKVWNYHELTLAIAEGRDALQAGAAAAARSLPMADDTPSLPQGDPAIGALMTTHGDLVERAKACGAYETVRDDWRGYRADPDERPEDLGPERLADWIALVRATVEQCEANAAGGTGADEAPSNGEVPAGS